MRKDPAEDETLDFLFKVRQDGQDFVRQLPRVTLRFVLGQVCLTVRQSHFHHLHKWTLGGRVTQLLNAGTDLLKIIWNMYPVQKGFITANLFGSKIVQHQVQRPRIQKLL